MKQDNQRLTGVERHFDEHEIIVSKTDLKGRITYANDTFLRVAGYRENEILGQPHSIIRHPDMPRCVFVLLWQTIEAGSRDFRLCDQSQCEWRPLLGAGKCDAVF